MSSSPSTPAVPEGAPAATPTAASAAASSKPSQTSSASSPRSDEGKVPFRLVIQKGRHDDTLAVIAMICSQPLAEIQRTAESLGLPKVGPYFHAFTDGLIAKVLMKHGWVSGLWKECTDFKDLPEVAIAMVDVVPELEMGRNVLFFRQKIGNKVVPLVLDPYPHTDQTLHNRTDLSGMSPLWFIPVKPINAASSKAKG